MKTKKKGFSKKEEYVEHMAEQLKEWSARIDEMEAKMGDTTAETRTWYEGRVQELKNRRDALSQKLQNVNNASGVAWETLRSGVDSAWEDFKNAFAEARDKFKKAA
jgi:predicted  nucleic acid-binding Zn-ribbon protein